MLWIALHLPLLSLESFAATLASDANVAALQPLALMDAQRIVSVNAAAEALGVKVGLKRATALALAPHLTLARADRGRDVRALEPVAHAALAFTPSVVIQPAQDADGAEAAAHTVLLEVEASLRYFGGFEALRQRLLTALLPLGHRFHIVSAPTAQGAALLARAHARLHCADRAAAQKALDAVPVTGLAAGREHRDTLQGMGLRTLGDLHAMPRAGLTRRFGEALLNEFDRAYGRAPDPRVALVLPPTFESRLELFARADTTEQVLYGAGVLLARLVVWLAAQQAFVRRFTLVMKHEARRLEGSGAPRTTALEIALAEPSRDSVHLLVLLRERLARLQLPAPTLDLCLQADDIARRAAPNHELFPTSKSEREGLTQLIERLQARLGPEQVQRLCPVEDHRPECCSRIEAVTGEVALRAVRTATATRPTRPTTPTTTMPTPATPASTKPHSPPTLKLRRLKAKAQAPAKSGAAERERLPTPHEVPAAARQRRPTSRPVWMLLKPESLPERRSRPLLGGQPLQLLSGPERIESGWWDASLAERDYFIAQTAEGALVWIYRARLPLSADGEAEGWFMQGRFG